MSELNGLSADEADRLDASWRRDVEDPAAVRARDIRRAQVIAAKTQRESR